MCVRFFLLGTPIKFRRAESLDQLGGRLQCVVAVQTFRDATATIPRFVAHQAVVRVDHLGKCDFSSVST